MQPTPGHSTVEMKERLEVEKLQAEIGSLRGSNSPWARAAHHMAVFTALVTAVSVGIGLFQFNREQQATARREEAGRSEELRKTYWQEQKKVYDQAANAVGTIAIAASLKDVAPELRQFWALYWGGMSLIEGHEVERAMMDFGATLTAWQQSGMKPGGGGEPLVPGGALHEAVVGKDVAPGGGRKRPRSGVPVSGLRGRTRWHIPDRALP